MKKVLVTIMGCLALSACAHGPTVDVNTSDDIVVDGQTIGRAPPPKMPELPPALSQRATRLPDLTDNTVSGLQADAIETDRRYNDVSHQLNSVLDAWECVRTALNSGKDAAECFKGL